MFGISIYPPQQKQQQSAGRHTIVVRSYRAAEDKTTYLCREIRFGRKCKQCGDVNIKIKRSLQFCPDSCQVSMNQLCSKACCWCRGTCVRYHHISAPAHSERGRNSSISEPRVDTVRCRHAARFTWTIFSRLPFLGVPSVFFEMPITKSIVVVPQKVTEGAIFRPLFLHGYYVDASGVCFAVYCTSQCRS